jgi:hypothetical protein
MKKQQVTLRAIGKKITGRDYVLRICRQRATSDAIGKVTMSKCGTTITRVPSDPSSDW